MRNMNLTPRPRDLTMLLNSDRQTETPFYRNTEKPNTGIPENRQNETPESGEDWVKTSVSLRVSTRRRLKTFAAEHDMRIQEVVDAALETYLGLNGGER